jgi:hypothetical protein
VEEQFAFADAKPAWMIGAIPLIELGGKQPGRGTVAAMNETTLTPSRPFGDATAPAGPGPAAGAVGVTPIALATAKQPSEVPSSNLGSPIHWGQGAGGCRRVQARSAPGPPAVRGP